MTIWQPPVIRKKFSIPQLVVSGCWRLMALTRKWWSPSHTDLQTSQKPTCNHMSLRKNVAKENIYSPTIWEMPPCDWLIAIILLGQRLKLQTCLQTLSMYARNYNETVKKMQQKWKIQKARIWIMKHVGCRIESQLLRWRWRFFISGLHYSFSSCITTWLVINKYL